jgi:hypothetical protein
MKIHGIFHENGMESKSDDLIKLRDPDFEIIQESNLHLKLTKIKYNSFLLDLFIERKKKELEEEDIPLCNCIRINGEKLCGVSCMNRLEFNCSSTRYLNLGRLCMIECSPQHCSFGTECTNIIFQKKQHGKVEVVQTERKGLGLVIRQDLREGDFIIEYIGEVISNDTCIDRMEKMKEDDTNVYFLTLNGSECIDAKNKGNYARYINHSCKPSCITQKW